MLLFGRHLRDRLRELEKFSTRNQVIIMKCVRLFDDVTHRHLGDDYMEKVTAMSVRRHLRSLPRERD
jgi:hypothetical protein